MQEKEKRDQHDWANFLSQVEIPVLASTRQALIGLREQGDTLGARAVSRIVLRDPMMTLKLLRYLQQSRPKHRQSEIAEVEQAILMLGVVPFFNRIPAEPVVETLLKHHPDALNHLLYVVDRSLRAANYAMEWAVRLNDLHFDEVYVAALLHDLAEILLWCFAPVDMLRIREAQQQDKSLRSRTIQETVLGFPIMDLQGMIARQWLLPPLLLSLMDDEPVSSPRVRSVTLAVNLARHSANGWNDAALADDYQNISALLHLPVEQVMALVGAPGETEAPPPQEPA